MKPYKKQITTHELEENPILINDLIKASEEYGRITIRNYNKVILYKFINSLRNIAIELARGDFDERGVYNINSRGLHSIINLFNDFTHQLSPLEYTKLLERIINEGKQ